MFAQVVIDSPVLQLDRIFDYELPADLAATPLGARVRVPFGRSNQFQDGFIIGKTQTSEFPGKHAKLESVVSTAPVLTPEIYRLARLIADRQVVALADVLRRAIPNRSVAVEKRWLTKPVPEFSSEQYLAQPNQQQSEITTSLTSPIAPGETWIDQLIRHCEHQIGQGMSMLAVLPDFRDVSLLEHELNSRRVTQRINCVRFGDEEKPSSRYETFLNSITDAPTLIFGRRSTAFSPVLNLGEIFVVDEANQSHREIGSPYISTREVAILRSQVSGTRVHFASVTRSAEMQRFVDLKFATEERVPVTIPRIRITESESRIDSHTWQVAREALTKGSVLIQVSTKGTAAGSYCANCGDRARCRNCNGPVWINESGHPQCRWCAALNLDLACDSCKSVKFRPSGNGSTKTLAQFGQIFPGAKLIESTADKPVLQISPGKSIVVATPGAIPVLPGGYSAVVILDAANLINRDWLRSLESANQLIGESIAHLSPGGEAIVVGIGGKYAHFLSSWQQDAIAAWQLAERTELKFPPAVRICSLEGAAETLDLVVSAVRKNHQDVEVLGPVQLRAKGESVERVILRFAYRDGGELAKTLRAESLKLSSGNRQNSRGKSVRAVRIAMDDSEVL